MRIIKRQTQPNFQKSNLNWFQFLLKKVVIFNFKAKQIKRQIQPNFQKLNLNWFQFLLKNRIYIDVKSNQLNIKIHSKLITKNSHYLILKIPIFKTNIRSIKRHSSIKKRV